MITHCLPLKTMLEIKINQILLSLLTNKDSKEFIDHSSLDENFKDHLDNNKRILFTAPFGSGKSTYLKYFFDESKDYVVLSLYPIDYSVTQNQDVFELIKFDLLCELLNKYEPNIELEKEEANFLLSTQLFALEKFNGSILNNFLYLSEKIGKSSKGLIKAIAECVKDINDFKQTVTVDEAQVLKKYLESHDNKQGSIYEWDDVSKLISNIINRLKITLKIENSVLIIDDLDRLDPEHIFRLFNIFSAHYDKQSEENKFGFDKVVFVCDIENIKKIYNHKYGRDVEFSGYIDKFYSTKPFVFDNKQLIKDKLKDLIRFKEKDLKHSVFQEQYSLDEDRSLFFMFLFWLTFSLVETGLLNLRTLISTKSIRFPSYHFNIRNDYDVSPEYALSYEFLTSIFILKSFFSDDNSFNEKLKLLSALKRSSFDGKIITYSDLSVIKKYCIGFCLPFLIDQKLLNSHDRDTSGEYEVKVLNSLIKYKFESFRNNRMYVTNPKEVNLNLYELIYTTYQECVTKGYIQ